MAFRKELVYKIIQKLDSGDHTQINVLEAIMMISKAWSNVHQSAILTPAEEDRTYLELQTAVTKFNTPCTLNEFLNIDNDVMVCETLTDEDILDNVRVHLPDNNNNDNDDQQEESKFGEPPTAGEAYALVRFFVHIN
ncbi:hypothetical protein QE152_g23271 [Popillia japonica]|uniref:DDE-1 domain-containing protein n=1 Tax=Popillia japonica TaxID=7064 RepID=A0AAW1KHI2_POPJA